ncbi:MAG: sugar transferase [Candidatus Pacebacteria bacterium]|nr:sugar transferase [Candidatus Paceibacterota bacterium]
MVTAIHKKEPIILAIGDVAMLVVSLVIALAIRYREIPSEGLIEAHALPFVIIFVYSIVAFYISGLYGRMISLARSSVPGSIIRAQVANGLIAVALFYFIPTFSVTPKVNLFIYLGLSICLLIIWRLSTYSLFSLRRKAPALVIGVGDEVNELISEMTSSQRIAMYCAKKVDPKDQVALTEAIGDGSPTFQYIVADVNDRHFEAALPELYMRFFKQANIIDLQELYEEVFDRIPLSRMNYVWIMTHVSSVSPVSYDALKRGVDIILGGIIGIVALILYPFVATAIKLEDGGSIFIFQERVGKNGKPIRIYKFRSMQRNESDKWIAEGSNNRVTNIGHFIRKTRIDELPQALSILKGDMSLIGPRTDVNGLADRLQKEIPYYSVRTVIKPGLTGWAQVNQEKPPQSVEETKIRLSYDLYYIKHRSISLDFRIILRTIRTVLSRGGM